MTWLLIGSLFFVVLHRALEGIVMQGEDHPRRKFLWDLGTGVFIVFAVAMAWVATLFFPAFRADWAMALLVATPVAVLGVAIFCYASYIVYSGTVEPDYDGELKKAQSRT